MISNFTYYNPTRIVFGSGSITKLNKLIPKKATVMLLYGGGSIMKNGVYDQVIAALKKREVVEFGGIEPNPDYDTLMKAVKQVTHAARTRVCLARDHHHASFAAKATGAATVAHASLP